MFVFCPANNFNELHAWHCDQDRKNETKQFLVDLGCANCWETGNTYLRSLANISYYYKYVMLKRSQ